MNLNIEPLKQVLVALREALVLYRMHEDDPALATSLRDSVVQRFEYTYELAWKMMVRWLRMNVSPEAAEEAYSRKELFRLAARQGLIEDPNRWFIYHDARNVSVHTYDESNAARAFAAARSLPQDVDFLIHELERRND